MKITLNMLLIGCSAGFILGVCAGGLLEKRVLTTKLKNNKDIVYIIPIHDSYHILDTDEGKKEMITITSWTNDFSFGSVAVRMSAKIKELRVVVEK